MKFVYILILELLLVTNVYAEEPFKNIEIHGNWCSGVYGQKGPMKSFFTTVNNRGDGLTISFSKNDGCRDGYIKVASARYSVTSGICKGSFQIDNLPIINIIYNSIQSPYFQGVVTNLLERQFHNAAISGYNIKFNLYLNNLSDEFTFLLNGYDVAYTRAKNLCMGRDNSSRNQPRKKKDSDYFKDNKKREKNDDSSYFK